MVAGIHLDFLDFFESCMKTCLCNDQRRSGQLFSHDANINIVLFSDVNVTM